MGNQAGLPPPVVFGFDPGKFPAWRHGQDDAINRVLNSPKRISVECLPTGAGKSLMGMAVGRLKGARTVILTRRKGLQSQMVRDFPIHDVRGQSAYQCAFSPSTTVDLGPCHAGMFCRYRDAGCSYYDAVKIAKDPQTPVTVTNYAFWFTQRRRGTGLGQIDLLVCDEAHGIMDELSNFLSVKIERWEIEKLPLGKWPEGLGNDLVGWKAWAAAEGVPLVAKAVDAAKEAGATANGTSPAAVRERRRLDSLLERVTDIRDSDGRWVIDLSVRGGTLTASPIWPGEYLDKYLFQGAKKILMMSATIIPKHLSLLSLAPADYDYHEVQSSFPVERRMVWCVDAPRMNHRMDEGEKGIWLDRIDFILGKRLDRKAIIHTGSYDRRNQLMMGSRHRNWMIGHSNQDVEAVIQRFKAAQPPQILVSQSLTEGYDFPYEDAEFQIISKIPYPDSRDALVAARQEEDKDYGSFVAMQAVVQAAGRAMRAEDDYCETFVVDGNSKWFFKKNQQFAPRWFNESVRQVTVVPEPGPRAKKPGMREGIKLG